MPRQRRRRRAAQAGRRTAAGIAALPASARPWWKPTLGVFVAFALGLWIGGTASFADLAGGVALIVGALGVGIGGPRLYTRRLRVRRRPEAAAAGQDSKADSDAAQAR